LTNIIPYDIVISKERRLKMTTTKAKYSNTIIEVYQAGNRRFLVKAGNNGHSYILARALGKLQRRVGAVIENTGYACSKYILFPEFSKATGNPCDIITEQILADFIANS
jgi:hypothetical protein